MDKFVFVHPGNTRPVGRVCDEHHTFHDGYYLGGVCHHHPSEGYISASDEEELYTEFLLQEHQELGHREPRQGCPWC